eukprot:462581-Amphidinium_carterae.1
MKLKCPKTKWFGVTVPHKKSVPFTVKFWFLTQGTGRLSQEELKAYLVALNGGNEVTIAPGADALSLCLPHCLYARGVSYAAVNLNGSARH